MSVSVTCLHICVYVYICYISLPMCISMYLILNVLVWMYVVVCAKKTPDRNISHSADMVQQMS